MTCKLVFIDYEEKTRTTILNGIVCDKEIIRSKNSKKDRKFNKDLEKERSSTKNISKKSIKKEENRKKFQNQLDSIKNRYQPLVVENFLCICDLPEEIWKIIFTHLRGSIYNLSLVNKTFKNILSSKKMISECFTEVDMHKYKRLKGHNLKMFENVNSLSISSISVEDNHLKSLDKLRSLSISYKMTESNKRKIINLIVA